MKIIATSDTDFEQQLGRITGRLAAQERSARQEAEEARAAIRGRVADCQARLEALRQRRSIASEGSVQEHHSQELERADGVLLLGEAEPVALYAMMRDPVDALMHPLLQALSERVGERLRLAQPELVQQLELLRGLRHDQPRVEAELAAVDDGLGRQCLVITQQLLNLRAALAALRPFIEHTRPLLEQDGAGDGLVLADLQEELLSRLDDMARATEQEALFAN